MTFQQSAIKMGSASKPQASSWANQAQGADRRQLPGPNTLNLSPCHYLLDHSSHQPACTDHIPFDSCASEMEVITHTGKACALEAQQHDDISN
jgi:hypothetical protein